MTLKRKELLERILFEVKYLSLKIAIDKLNSLIGNDIQDSNQK